MTMDTSAGPGPLSGIKVIELAGIGPIQLGCMLLADLGAEVVRVERPGGQVYLPPEREVLHRNRPSIAVDLHTGAGSETVLRLADQADVLIEAFRPGVAERLGVGPEVARGRNSRLIYARMTGWGQEGPLAQRAGHDINYIALTGVLAAIGREDTGPVPPLNLVGDFGGGSMFLVAGVLAALLERHNSGEGQVLDVAMVDGASYLMASCFSAFASGQWRNERGSNYLDGGAPFYDTYLCQDDKYISVGAHEPQFFALLVETLGLDDVPRQHDATQWPRMRSQFEAAFRSRTRQQWAEAFADTDGCVTPVMDIAEAADGEHLAARGTFTREFGVVQPSPAPRFSRTPGRIRSAPTAPGADTAEVLQNWGFASAEIEQLILSGAVHTADQSESDRRPA